MEIAIIFSVLLLGAGSASVACVLYTCQGDYSTWPSRLLLLIGSSLLVWGLGLSLLTSAATLTAARAGAFIAPVGYCLLFGFFLHYILFLTGRTGYFTRWWSCPLLYLPGILSLLGFVILPLSGHISGKLIQTGLGWVVVARNAWVWFYFCYYAAYSLASIILLVQWSRRLRSGVFRKQALLLLCAFAAMFVLGTLTDVAPGLFHVELPGIASAFAVLPILAISYSVKKLNFMKPALPNPDETILNSVSSAGSIYIILGSYFIAGSLINLLSQIMLNGGDDLPGTLLFSGVLLACGFLIFILNRSVRDVAVKELLLAFIFSLFIPAITFRFIQYGSITIWTLTFLLIIPSMLFNRRILLVTILISALQTQFVLLSATPNAYVRVDASDYVVRLGFILMAAFLCFFVSWIYRRRLHENTKHAVRQTLASEISRNLLLVSIDNWEERIPVVLEQCNQVLRGNLAYLALLDESAKVSSFCEWADGNSSFIRDIPWEDKSRFLTFVHRQLMDRDQDILTLSNGTIPQALSSEFESAAAALGIQSAIALPVMQGARRKGLLCYGSIQAEHAWDAESFGFIRIISNMYADTLTKLDAVRQIHHIAYHDQLTGLPNRLMLKDRFEKAAPLANRTAKMLGVVFFDLDSFKSVNDTMGHELGDQLLKTLAAALSQCVRSYDTIARVGGDEFVLLLEQITRTADLLGIMDKVMDVIRQPVILQDQEFFVTGSAGIALYPQDGQDAETLIANADIAMYHAKSLGKNRYALCSQDMKDEIVSQMKLTNLLYSALERNQLIVYYQPQVSLESHEIVGLEALLRWNLPEKGLVSPGIFIPLAEKAGLIQSIGRWVLETACRQSRAWQNLGYAPVRMAVNVSVQQLYLGNFPEQVREVLRATGLAPELLELEVTESVANSGTPNISKIFAELKQMGVSLSIDDFGTEYSSLNRLKLLPVDRLKLDIQFVRGIEDSEKDRAIARTIISLAKSLNMKVIAEGVETEPQLDFLGQRMCDEVQGFYYYKPMPAEEMEKHLRRDPARQPDGTVRAEASTEGAADVGGIR